MRPSIDFHHVAKIDLSPIREFPKTDDCEAFAARDLIVTGADGQRFEITLYGKDAIDLRLPMEIKMQMVGDLAERWNAEDGS